MLLWKFMFHFLILTAISSSSLQQTNLHVKKVEIFIFNALLHFALNALGKCIWLYFQRLLS